MKTDVAEILKNKPKGTVLYDALRDREVAYDFITKYKISCYTVREANISYSPYGTWPGAPDGLQILFPSKKMQDWNKFAWKKGDILVAPDGTHCFFYEWLQDDYDKFKGYYPSDNGSTKNYTFQWKKETDENAIKEYINEIEKINNAHLNLETLEFEEKQPQFKDGDILVAEKDCYYDKDIFIAKIDDEISSIVLIVPEAEDYEVHFQNYKFFSNRTLRLATDSEKQQLFDALTKANKYWNAETKTLEDMPKEHEFKPKDWCLMCNFIHGGVYKTSLTPWVLSQFSHYDGQKCCAVGGNKFSLCIPYNKQTEHLLGTTGDWKGGKGWV